ncbi:MAG: OmpA family protein [Bacteroidales bacterium]|nr:OmpA family protein [Bacteroidales bacterium]
MKKGILLFAILLFFMIGSKGYAQESPENFLVNTTFTWNDNGRTIGTITFTTDGIAHPTWTDLPNIWKLEANNDLLVFTNGTQYVARLKWYSASQSFSGERDVTSQIQDGVKTVMKEVEKTIIDANKKYFYTENNSNADIVVRVGDIDNLGFGWDKGFDPFCGKNTRVHSYPWTTNPKDHVGTDRIMVVSSYKSGRSDGYVARTKRPENNPIDIKITFKKPTIKIEKVVIQMMLDDFQAPVWGTSFQFHVNGKRLTYVEDIINKLKQTGPIGKLVQVGLLPEDNHLFETGNVSIKIDDPITGAGDGFAIDFIQLLINPKGKYKCIGNIKGVVKDEEGNLLENVLVSANGLKENLTESNGNFSLQAVPIGVLTVTASKSMFSSASINFELKKDENKIIELILKKKTLESEDYLSKELKEKGFVNLYGIRFDSGKDIPKSESEATLNEVANFLRNNPNLKIEIIGHTDSDGDNKLNEDLSLRRAQSIINWLKSKGVNISNLSASGLGESNPVANNKTESGKALNRRVEIKIFK